MQVFLETQRLVLRRFSMDDVDNLVNLDADPDVMRFVTGGVPTSRDEIENEVLPAFLGYYERYEGYGFWAVIQKETGEFLGWFHFRPHAGAAPGEVELGYRLRASAWGKGYATEGSRALIGKGFTELGVQRVTAEAMAVNTASRRVMEKAGLRLVRAFHQPWPYPIDGDQFGDVEYGLDKPAGTSRTRTAAVYHPPGQDRRDGTALAGLPRLRRDRSFPRKHLTRLRGAETPRPAAARQRNAGHRGRRPDHVAHQGPRPFTVSTAPQRQKRTLANRSGSEFSGQSSNQAPRAKFDCS
ncbi:MAG: GNAT family N-acetyltransferase [Streptosporangiaceae bacterium]